MTSSLDSDIITKDEVFARLRTIFDPETGVNIVDMGFIYKVQIEPTVAIDPTNSPFRLKITYTLTTPACPLAATLQDMMFSAFADLEELGFIPERDLVMELSFDPPWTLDHLSEEAKAELGF